ncbi:NRAMP family divalent metal transporter [Puniceicoccus vermicola]|uniref:Divalent metal cation transporter n=1 Tax=Puniceicoccus vermicola TaxID=388746 RepID=A0A7X1AX59_9BACT|nr:divalent metal cation transporter [Puniceicoccus vermicola]MBC2601487.1 divalent metal cation transporter [Puniceicoccus vermicola]
MEQTTPSSGNLLKAIGPGLLVACAAIGGSHLVWSTRAGAEYGWQLLGLLFLANLFKYPFFLYGQKYTAATGESLLAGYERKSIFCVYAFLGINVLTGVINIAGVSMLSAALLAGFGVTFLTIPHLTIVIMIVGALLILLGHYRVLDSIARLVIVTLTISTLVALILALREGGVAPPDFEAPSPWTWASFGFLIMFMGWMPAPIDLSAWSSLWMFSREKQTGHFASVRETQIDFHLGYGMAVGMAVIFLALGALVMFGSGETFSSSGIVFSQQLVELYSKNIGDWSYYLILSAAFITMLSTSITCVDGYPRALAACTSLIVPSLFPKFRLLHGIWIVVSVAAASVIILQFVSNLLQLLGFAAIISFVTSPVLAGINFWVMSGENVPEEHRPGPVLKALSWLGIAFFVVMTVGFVYSKFIA